ncbi:hypothetical protein PoB_002473500 [Plakobranchus ocellatus]|uniref:Uncharacterized protein n=1 Tax=Plakobranchus ocellatus TaxID=259542 RepID=A0AAV3ZUA3_9GAST|nr:hypothetical protein PoB_002473500 [Plakobranchus ocellatus]
MHKEQFQLEISNRFNALEENKPTIENFHKIMEEEPKRFGENGKDKPKEKLEEDIEIQRLDVKRKTLKKKEGKKTLKILNTQNLTVGNKEKKGEATQEKKRSNRENYCKWKRSKRSI